MGRGACLAVSSRPSGIGVLAVTIPVPICVSNTYGDGNCYRVKFGSLRQRVCA